MKKTIKQIECFLRPAYNYKLQNSVKTAVVYKADEVIVSNKGKTIVHGNNNKKIFCLVIDDKAIDLVSSNMYQIVKETKNCDKYYISIKHRDFDFYNNEFVMERNIDVVDWNNINDAEYKKISQNYSELQKQLNKKLL